MSHHHHQKKYRWKNSKKNHRKLLSSFYPFYTNSSTNLNHVSHFSRTPSKEDMSPIRYLNNSATLLNVLMFKLSPHKTIEKNLLQNSRSLSLIYLYIYPLKNLSFPLMLALSLSSVSSVWIWNDVIFSIFRSCYRLEPIYIFLSAICFHFSFLDCSQCVMWCRSSFALIHFLFPKHFLSPLFSSKLEHSLSHQKPKNE